MVCKEPPPSPLLLPVQEGPPGHSVPAFQCHLTRTPCLLRHSAECRVPGAFIPDSQLGQRHVGIIPAGKPGILGSGREGTATAESLGSTIWVVALQACRAKLVLLPSSDCGSKSNSARSTSWNVDLVRATQELHPSVRP